MGRLDLKYRRIPADSKKFGEGFSINSLSPTDFDKFNESILGLGDISRRGQYVQCVAAVFDLEGFTAFGNQVDPHLVIPDFLQRFLTWLFSEIRTLFQEGRDEETVTVWASLPFFAKFLGDGVLMLWDAEHAGGDNGILNIVARIKQIPGNYTTSLLPALKEHVTSPPLRLRCGVARGQVMSVGDGNDYVGSCINIATRLQKISDLSFAVSRRGLDLHNAGYTETFKDMVVRQIELRGIGNNELIWILESELNELPAIEQRSFRDPKA